MKVAGKHYRSIWADPRRGEVSIIDQTWLPHNFEIRTLHSPADIAEAIRTMRVRGAPLIGVAAAFGVALAVSENSADSELDNVIDMLHETRPTAVNLAWALERMRAALKQLPFHARGAAAWEEAQRIADEDAAMNEAIGRHGMQLIAALHAEQRRPVQILTHCNAGWIATVDWGTALSAIYKAHDAAVPLHVWVSETRPRNQGLLTAWELREHGVPHTLITDNAGSHYMQRGQVDMVLVGADRATRRGDVCNKIGTYQKALAANDNGIPFYAAVPSPTIDWAIADAMKEIPIEERAGDEVRLVAGMSAQGQGMRIAIAPQEVPVGNPAFDITPARLVTGIVTERGVSDASESALLALFPERRQKVPA
jgi:methylthioribose-1-phosphate isomerase